MYRVAGYWILAFGMTNEKMGAKRKNPFTGPLLRDFPKTTGWRLSLSL